ncbi:MAG: ABC transporter permease subunit/CPBP intramembrane protease, partial [Lachnospiraceae bacterium]
LMTASTSKVFTIGFKEITRAEDLEQFFRIKETDYDYTFAFVTGYSDKTFEQALQEGNLHAVLQEEMVDGKTVYRIVYDSSENDSVTAANMVEDMLLEYREYLRENIIENAGLSSDDVLYPLEYSYQDVASNEETVGNMFGYILPFLLITSILMGAMYPAIDTTAGEKERGTLETLMTMPVTNLELITGKFLATSTIAVFAAFLNVLSMALLGAYFYASLQATAEETIAFDASLYIPAILITLLCAIVFSLFASAVCLCVCIYAKSFKEAQNYTTPVMLLFMFAGMVCMVPQLQLGNGLELVPVVNIALLIANLFQLKFNWAIIGSVLGSNLVYCVLAILFMAKMFHSEDVLFGEGTFGIHLLDNRKDMKKKQIPGLGDLVLLFAILLLVVLLAGSLLIVKFGVWGLVAEQLLILAITIGYSTYIRVDWNRVFHLKKPDFRYFISGFLCWSGVYLIMMLLTAVLTYIMPKSVEQADAAILQIWQNTPIWLIVLSSAILPAICEEFAFRGFLFGSLSRKYKIGVAICWTGLLFGAYHMNMVKLFVVGILGALLAYMTYKTGSIWIAVFMHFLNNLMAVLLSEKPDMMKEIFPVFFQNTLSAATVAGMALGAAALLAGGIALTKYWAGDFGRNPVKTKEQA